MKDVTRALDGSAIALSSLCLIHCLVLPIVAALLPAFGAWTRAEWVHVLFVLVAAPLSSMALLRKIHGVRAPGPVLALAGAGVMLLAAGAFAAPTETAEAICTVAGSLCLAAAHVLNWRGRSQPAGDHCLERP